MRTLLFLLVVVLAVALVSCKRPNKSKRFRCKSDADCRKNQCCIKTKFFSKCFWKRSEGAFCGFAKGIHHVRHPMCGCKEGLVCKKSGFFIKKCTDEGGSGEEDFMDY